jgi:hypothetical protein
MANTLKLAATTTSGHTPDGLQLGELAVNTTNKKVWVGTNGNTSGNVLLYDQATAYTNTTYSEGDHGLTQANFTDTLRTKLNGIAASATNTAAPHYTSAIAVGDGGLTQKNFTTTLKSKLDGIAASATNTAAPHYTSAIAVGAGGLTQQNFTTTLKNKLDAIEAGATADQDLSAYVTNTELSNELDALVDAAPGALDTLNELAASIGDDASYATTVTNALAGKSSTSHTHSVTAGQFSQQNFTTTLKNKLDGIAASATNTAAPHYTSAIAVGDGGLTQKNFTTTLKNKLDAIEAGATADQDLSGYLLKTGGTIDGGTNTTLNIRADDAGVAKLVIGQSTDGSQGTGVVEVTQDGSHGGGISYNGDNSPAFASGETADWITFYALNAGTRTEVFGYSYASTGAVTFNGALTWSGGGSANANTAYTHSQDSSQHQNTTYSVGDGGLTQKNFTTTLKNKLDGIATGATNTAAPFYTSPIAVTDGGLTQKNFTTTLKSKLDGIAASATNTAAPYYTSAIAVGAGGLTQQNFTTTLKSKLDGIAASATNTPDWTASGVGTIHAHNYTNTTYAEGDHGLTQANFTDTLRTKLNGIAASATNTAAPYYTSAIASTSLTNWAASSAGTIHSSNYTNTTYSVGAGGLTQQNFTTTLKSKLDGIAASATNTAAPYYTSAIAVGAGGLTQQNFTTTLKNKLDGIAASATNTAAPFYTSAIAVGAGGLTQQNFTTTLKNKLDGIAASATNTAAPFYTSAIAVGAGGLTQQNFTTTLKNKLDGIAAGAQVNVGQTFNGAHTGLNFGGGYVSHWVGSPYNHIPANGSSGQFLGYASGGTAQWVANPNTTYSAGAGINLSGTTFSLTTSAFTDATSAVDTVSDEVMMFDAGVPSRKRFTEIFGSNAYNSTAFITSSQPTMSMLFGGAASGVTNQGLSRDVAYKIMNNVSSSVACVTTVGGSSNEYLRYASGGNFSWDTIEYNQLQNISALTALP